MAIVFATGNVGFGNAGREPFIEPFVHHFCGHKLRQHSRLAILDADSKAQIVIAGPVQAQFKGASQAGVVLIGKLQVVRPYPGDIAGFFPGYAAGHGVQGPAPGIKPGKAQGSGFICVQFNKALIRRQLQATIKPGCTRCAPPGFYPKIPDLPGQPEIPGLLR